MALDNDGYYFVTEIVDLEVDSEGGVTVIYEIIYAAPPLVTKLIVLFPCYLNTHFLMSWGCNFASCRLSARSRLFFSVFDFVVFISIMSCEVSSTPILTYNYSIHIYMYC